MMYESPITLINGETQLSLEDGVYKAVRQVGIEVDKDELIKALKYDRGQYEKGYADAKAEQKKGKWIDRGVYECSVCHERSCCAGNYCPDCGADMRGENDDCEEWLVDKMPTVEPEQKRGKWVVKVGDLYPGEKCGTCSRCGYQTEFYLFYDYCPKCGARMEGEE